MKKQLDIDIMKNLYEFGGLQVYQLKIFDPITFQMLTPLKTFNEHHAKEVAESYRKRDFHVMIESFIVKFDNAFEKKETTNETAT